MISLLDRLSLCVKTTIAILMIVAVLQAFLATLMILDSNRHIAEEQSTGAELVAQGVARACELAMAVGDKSELSRSARSFLQNPNTVFVAIYDRSDVLLAAEANDQPLWEEHRKGRADNRRVLVGEEMVQVASEEEFGSGAEEGVARPAGRLGRVVVGLSTESMHAAQRSQMIVVVRTTAIIMVICGPVVYFPVARWTGRLKELVGVSERIAQGDLSRPITFRRTDEIGRLALSFDEMRRALVRRELELQQFNESLHQRVLERTHELTLATAAAQAAVRSKGEFLANMSHEIRTPMSAIIGYAELLMEPGQTPAQCAEYTQTIRRNGEHLLIIINDVLDLSKIEAGKMRVEHISCSPVQIVEEVVSLMRVRATGRGLQLNTLYHSPLPSTIHSDPTRLRQILMNLCGNAIKFTDSGEVRVELRVVDEDGAKRLEFDIVDTGPGMTAEQIDTLFAPFTQADSSTTRKYGGTGLGLSISSRLATMLHGEIKVKSVAGQGSTFTVTLRPDESDAAWEFGEIPASAPPEEEALSERPQATVTGRILLAEDGRDNQRLIAFHLRRAGAEVSIVENGRLAFEAAMERQRIDAPFDLIVMDMQMPEMDGYEATRLLRKNGYDGAIMALTAHAMSEDRDKCLSAGCDGYDTKPIDRLRLVDCATRAMKVAMDRRAAA